jgi:TPR repeat protein
MRFITLILVSTYLFNTGGAYAQNPFPMRDIRQSAERSQAAVSLNLALSLIEGRGVAKNISDAKDILDDIISKKPAAHPQSMEGRIVSVAYITLAKLELKADPVYAKELLHQGAVHYGNPEGQYWLGKIALDAGNKKQASRWFSLAVQKSNQPAMVELGRLLFDEKNTKHGLMYLMLSQDKEDKEAVLRDNFPDIYAKSSPEDREAAMALVTERQKK